MKKQKLPMEEKLILYDEGEKLPDKRLYQALVGSLLYANMGTRPDISFAMHQLTRHMETPYKAHLTYAQKLGKISMRYS